MPFLVWVALLKPNNRNLIIKGLLRNPGTESPRMAKLKLTTIAPGPDGRPNFQFPRVWDLKDLQGY